MHTIKGTLLYSPQRANLKREDQANTLILDLPQDDLDKYYQWFINRQYGSWLKLQSPMFGTHVTVVRPQEANTNHPKWLAYDGKTVEIQYSVLERHWEFWSLNVHSEELVSIRSELGLRTDFRLHITVGRQFDWQPKVIFKNFHHDTDYI